MKRIFINTGIYSIILIILSIGSQIGNWPDEYFKKTILWFLPSVFAYFVGINTAVFYIERNNKNIDGYTQFTMTVSFTIVVLMFSIFSNMNHWPMNWLHDTIMWLFPSCMSFYIGMGTEIRSYKKKKKNAQNKVSIKSKDQFESVENHPRMVNPNHSSMNVDDLLAELEEREESPLMPIVVNPNYSKNSNAVSSTEVIGKREGTKFIILNRADFPELQ